MGSAVESGAVEGTARRVAHVSRPVASAGRRRGRDGLEVLIRRALRAAVEGAEPSARVWEGLRRRVLS